MIRKILVAFLAMAVVGAFLTLLYLPFYYFSVQTVVGVICFVLMIVSAFVAFGAQSFLALIAAIVLYFGGSHFLSVGREIDAERRYAKLDLEENSKPEMALIAELVGTRDHFYARKIRSAISNYPWSKVRDLIENELLLEVDSNGELQLVYLLATHDRKAACRKAAKFLSSNQTNRQLKVMHSVLDCLEFDEIEPYGAQKLVRERIGAGSITISGSDSRFARFASDFVASLGIQTSQNSEAFFRVNAVVVSQETRWATYEDIGRVPAGAIVTVHYESTGKAKIEVKGSFGPPEKINRNANANMSPPYKWAYPESELARLFICDILSSLEMEKQDVLAILYSLADYNILMNGGFLGSLRTDVDFQLRRPNVIVSDESAVVAERITNQSAPIQEFLGSSECYK